MCVGGLVQCVPQAVAPSGL